MSTKPVVLDESALQESIKMKLQQYKPANDKANFEGPRIYDEEAELADVKQAN